MPREPVYTDMGPDMSILDSEGVISRLPRYGVWKWDVVKGRHQVADVGDDLEALRAKHGEGPLLDLPRPATPD